MKTRTKNILKMLGASIISGITYSIAIVCFINKYQLLSSGIGGIAIIIGRLISNEELMQNTIVAILTIVFNLPLMILAFKKIGKLYTIFTSIQLVLSAVLIRIMPSTACDFLQLTAENDMLLISIIAGGLIGLTSGLSLKAGCSTGGIDTLSTFFGIRFNKQIGFFAFAINATILLIGGILFKNWQCVLYTVIAIAVASVVIDILYRRAKKRLIRICTKKEEEVVQAIIAISKHGLTIGEVRGGYDRNPRKLIETIVLEQEVKNIIKAAKTADPESFISVLNVYQTIGKYTMPDFN